MTFEEEFEEIREITSYWEELWKKGMHQVRSGDKIEIMDMSVHHLRNTIKYFKPEGFDTSVLEKELKDRLENDERPCLTNPKRCIDCKKTKKASEFSRMPKYRTLKSGERTKSYLLKSVCRKCDTLRTKGWQKRNRKKYLEYQKNYKKVK